MTVISFSNARGAVRGERKADDRNNLSKEVTSIAVVLESIIKMVGGMGLPLALIAVGGALKLKHISKNKVILSIAAFAKLVIMPAIAMIMTYFFYPDIDHTEKGVTILLMAMPSAVALYVTYKQFISENGYPQHKGDTL